MSTNIAPSLSIPSGRATMILGVDGMASPRVEHAIETSLARLPGVTAHASYASRSLKVEFDRGQCQIAEIVRRLDSLGLRLRSTPDHLAIPTKEPLSKWIVDKTIEYHKMVLAVLGALLLIGAVITRSVEGPAALRYTLVISSFIVAGWFTGLETFHILLQLKFDIDVLMFAAAFGAAALGKPEEGAFLLVLFAFGGAGEELAMDKARRAIEALAKLAPDTATRREADGRETLVKVDQLQMEDLVVVRPFDRFPVDGVVETGTSAVDQSPITGESVPVEKGVHDPVFAGTINGEGLLTVRVKKLSTESTLARIVKMVNEAQTTKSPTQLFTDRVEQKYVPMVLIGTVIVMILPPLLHLNHRHHDGSSNWGGWFYNAMAFLTAASPCALAIGTPAAVLSGIAKAARIGVLVKGGVHLENLGKINVIAFDKTGTLTRGRPDVTDVVSFSGAPTDEILTLAASIEQSSSHPLASAIVNYARAHGIKPQRADDVQQVSGQGIRGNINGRLIGAGRAEMFNHQMDDLAQKYTDAGKTIVVIGENDKPIGLIALADQLRDNAPATIARLKQLGIKHTIMLTGDKKPVAEEVARKVGVDAFHAELLPNDKLELVTTLQNQYGPLAMIGDGVNDAPALAKSTVGIAMGGAGTDVAIETADVALMADDLSKLPQAIALSRFSRMIIKQNLTIALGVIAILAPMAAMGFANLWIAVLFHEGSTVVVVLNSLRLLVWKDRKAGQ